MTGIDMNRGSSGVNLPEAVAAEIWSGVQDQSLVMRLARQMPLPGSGVTVPVITGDPEASWVAETDEKPVSRGTVSNKSITPYKLAVIEPFSNEFARDLPGLYAELVRRLPGVLGTKFDSTVFFGTTPGSGFDDLSGVGTQDITKGASAAAYTGMLTAMGTVAAADGDITAWAVSPAGEINLLGQMDGNDRPLFTVNPQTDGSVGSALGRPVFKAKAVGKAGSGSVAKTLGFAGDWSNAVWGSVEGVKMTRLDQATLTDGTQTVDVDDGTSGATVTIPKYLNLAQRNMFALRIEIEVGFVVRDAGQYLRLTGPKTA